MLDKMTSLIRTYMYDNYPVHILTVGEKADKNLSLTDEALTLTTISTETVVFKEENIGDKNCQLLFEKLLGSNIPTAFSASFRGEEFLKNVVNFDAPLTGELKIYTKKFYSDLVVFDFIKLYLTRYLQYPGDKTDEEYKEILDEFKQREYDHLCIYVAILMVDYRRVSAYAQQFFNGSIFADGSGSDINAVTNGDFESVSVNIGDVFNLTEGNGYNSKFPTTDDGTAIGSENFFGDFDSFWYRIFLWLRDKLEQGYNDFSFRKNNGLWSDTILDKPLTYYQYFDSYPYPEQARQVRRGLSQASR